MGNDDKRQVENWGGINYKQAEYSSCHREGNSVSYLLNPSQAQSLPATLQPKRDRSLKLLGASLPENSDFQFNIIFSFSS